MPVDAHGVVMGCSYRSAPVDLVVVYHATIAKISEIFDPLKDSSNNNL
jgi:hypothetical protein